MTPNTLESLKAFRQLSGSQNYIPQITEVALKIMAVRPDYDAHQAMRDARVLLGEKPVTESEIREEFLRFFRLIEGYAEMGRLDEGTVKSVGYQSHRDAAMHALGLEVETRK